MDLYAVDRREKLRVSVQACLDRAPIIVVSPVGLDALQKFDLRAICPGFPTKQLRPSRAVEALPQVDEVGLGDAELERGDFAHCARSLLICPEIGRAECRESGGRYVEISVVAVS